MTMNFHAKSVDETLKLTETTQNGLTSAQATERQLKFGANSIETSERTSVWSMLLEQFSSPLVLILVAACVFSFFQNEIIDASAILLILVANAILGVYQQYKSEGALESLRKLAAPKAQVLRDNHISTINASELVVGDIVILTAGDMVPADIRLVEAIKMSDAEAILTGESKPSKKDASVQIPEKAVIGDRCNMAYMGTVVSTGRGKGIVTGIGKQTAMGEIAVSLASVKRDKTPLELQLNQLGGMLSLIFVSICALIFGLFIIEGLFINHQSWAQIFTPALMTSISLAVAAIPEGLPTIVTIVLSIGVTRMSKEGAIIRRLSSVETLGCTTVICTDKTGTLTENKMKVERAFVDMVDVDVIVDRPESLVRLARIAEGCNDAAYTAEGKLIGDPTETALVDFARLIGIPLHSVPMRVDEIPFDSDRKAMTTVHREHGKMFAFTKGAFEVVLDKSNRIEINGVVKPIDAVIRQHLEAGGRKITHDGYRTMGFAYKEAPVPDPDDKVEEKDLILVGFLGLKDPIRQQVPASVKDATEAGIKTVMVTGDHPETAMIYAKKLGIATEKDIPITGNDFIANPPDLDGRILTTRVFARVSPHDKLRIVEVFQRSNEVVAMTGDGVNDAPALKRADIGVSMGLSGTEVAKDASSLILIDDSFSTIVKAVYEGRVIYDNIIKFIWYMLGANIGEVFIVLLGLIFYRMSPLAPIQLLLINLLTDGLPALALGVEPAEHGIMKRKPRNPKKKIMDSKFLLSLIVRGLIMGAAVFGAYVIGTITKGADYGETYAFLTCIISELLMAYVGRSFTKHFWEIKPMTNPQLLLAITASLILSAICFIPGLSTIFKVQPLALVDVGIIIGISILPALIIDLIKADQ
jgi:P-type Ca2+ transporter type 2C